MNDKKINRRDLLKLGLGMGGGIFALAPGLKALAAAACRATAPQTEGPFYPVQEQEDVNNDLTQLKGRTQRARGEIIYIVGRVQDEACNPVAGALVEIWQASFNGRYNHPGDSSNPEPLDPNFQYWGRAVTDDQGEYLFKTIMPGSYPAGDGWIRPPHIHYKIQKRGFMELTTQMYFEGNAYNASDRVLQRLSQVEQQGVVVRFETSPPHLEPKSRMGIFNITLERA